MVVVIDQFGYFERSCRISIEYCPSISGVRTGVARTATDMLDKVIVHVDFVDGAEHAEGYIIHPNDSEDLIVDDNAI